MSISKDPVFASRVIGTGSAFPETKLTNLELSKRVDTSDEWIVERTGIRERSRLSRLAIPTNLTPLSDFWQRLELWKWLEKQRRFGPDSLRHLHSGYHSSFNCLLASKKSWEQTGLGRWT